jgi:hypothetical protein
VLEVEVEEAVQVVIKIMVLQGQVEILDYQELLKK